MNKVRTLAVTLTLFGSLAGGAYAQTTTLAHWDFVDGVKEGTGGTAADTLAAEINGIDCVTPIAANPTTLHYSTSTSDSENNAINGANCFAGWVQGSETSSSYADRYVGYKVNFASIAVGNISELSFDIANYRSQHTARRFSQFDVEILKNGVSTASITSLSFGNGTADTHDPSGVPGDGLGWLGSFHHSIDVSSYGLSSGSGSADSFEFRFRATPHANTQEYVSSIAMDNVRLDGNVVCVPEPSSSLLLGLSSLGLLARRVRRK